MEGELSNKLIDIERAEYLKRWRKYVKMLERFLNDVENYINHGVSGVVYSFGNTGFCTKLIENKDHRIGNPIYKITNPPFFWSLLFWKKWEGFLLKE